MRHPIAATFALFVLTGLATACGSAGGRGGEQAPEPDVPDILVFAVGAPTGQEAYLKSALAAESQSFGGSVAVSGDTVAVTGGGVVQVYVRSGGTWSQQAVLEPEKATGGIGGSVAIHRDTIVVGARGDDNVAVDSGAAYVFVRSGTTWSEQSYLKASNPGASDAFGVSVAVSGDLIAVGAPDEDSNATGVNGNPNSESMPNSGAAYVFR